MMRRMSLVPWVRMVEHWVLRAASMICSVFSAYAIHLFFIPLNRVDNNEVILTWAVAGAFGGLGYIVSRGLVHRMMQKERIWVYLVVCLPVVFVDVACNYVLSASAVQSDQWLAVVPPAQRGTLTVITYLILTVIPLMSVALAVVDMDLERAKGGGAPAGRLGMGNTVTSRPAVAPVARASAQQAQTSQQANNSAAAKRASFWSNRQAQQQSQQQQARSGSARSLTEDPEKTAVMAEVP